MLFPPKPHYVPGDGVCLHNAYRRGKKKKLKKVTQQKNGHVHMLAWISEAAVGKGSSCLFAFTYFHLIVCFVGFDIFFPFFSQQLMYSYICFEIFSF